jgi:hypothetical protein
VVASALVRVVGSDVGGVLRRMRRLSEVDVAVSIKARQHAQES